MEFHEAADAFPMMDAKRFAELKADIQQHNLRVPLTICDGKILDGRNRAKACKELGIEPTTKTYDGDPWAYVWSLNGQRRDLSGEQRGAIWIQCNERSEAWQKRAAEIAAAANEKRSEAAKGNENAAKNKSENSGRSQRSATVSHSSPTRKEQAKAAGVSEGVLSRAAALHKKRPDLAEKVRKGEMSPVAARREAGLKSAPSLSEKPAPKAATKKSPIDIAEKIVVMLKAIPRSDPDRARCFRRVKEWIEGNS